MNCNVYVDLKQPTKEEIKKYTRKNHKKIKKSIFLNVKNTGSIKQESLEDSRIESNGTTKEHTPSKSGQEFGIKNEVEATDVVEVETEQDNQIIPISEDTTYSNYIANLKGNDFICEICNANFNSSEEILVHRNLMHRTKPFICEVCNAQFVLSAHLYVHQSEHYNSSVNLSEVQSSSKSHLTINPRRNYKNSKSTSELAKKSCNTNTSVNLQPNHHNICNNISKSSSEFQCKLCIKSFKSKQSLSAHFGYHTLSGEIISRREISSLKKTIANRLRNSFVKGYVSPNVTNFNRNHKCKVCNRHFTTRGQLNSHQKQHRQQMVCNKCHKKFVFKKNFVKHLLSHTNVITSNDKSISGKKIIKRTDDKRTKQDNLQNIKLFHCSYCNIYYKTKQSLDRHYRQQHPRSILPGQKQNSTIVTRSCKTNTSVNFQQNVSNNLTQNSCVADSNKTLQKTKCKSLKCPFCVFATWSQVKLRNHFDVCKNISKSSSEFQCNLCIKSFKTQPSLSAHFGYHTSRGEIISTRELSLKKKRLRNQLRNRLRNSFIERYVSPNVTHFNRNHKCKVCNTHFTTRGQLNSHQKQHRQQMVCNKCHKKFVFKKNFEKHLLSHTNVITSNDKSISGKKIIKRTDDKRTKQDNLQNKKLFHCSYCNIYCKTKQSLDRHYRQQHPRSELPGQKQNSTIVTRSCKTNTSVNFQQNVSNNLTQNSCVADSNKTLQKTKWNSLKCPFCVFVTWSEVKLRNHFDVCKNILKSSSEFQCKLCIKSFQSKQSLSAHFGYHTSRGEIISTREQALKKKRLRNRMRNSFIEGYVSPNVTHFNRIHKCKDCNRHFTTRDQLNSHQKQHRQQMVCNKCHKKFVFKKNFEKHLLSHTKYVITSNDKSISGKKIIKCTDDKRTKQDNLQNKKLFHCSNCNICYKTKQSLDRHYRQQHPRSELPGQKQNSTIVTRSCKTNTSVNFQQNVSNNLTQNFCVADSNETLQKTKCKSLKCPFCVFATGSEVKLRNHFDVCKNISKSSSEFQCKLCIKSFQSKQSLSAHFGYHTSRGEIISTRERALRKAIANRLRNSFIGGYVFPIVTHFTRNHKCKDCNRHFTTRGQLNSHQKQHKQQMICNKCHKKFVFKKNFEKHLLSHTNVITSINKSISGKKIIMRTDDNRTKQDNLQNKKLFHCSYCNNYYKTKQSLDRHYRQQHPRSELPGQKQNSTIVTRSCKTNTSVNFQQNVSNNLTQNSCVADSNKTLQKTKWNSLKCPFCVFVTWSEVKLRNHFDVCKNILKSSSEFQCKLCIKSFQSKQSLSAHFGYHTSRGEIISRRELALKKKRLRNSFIERHVSPNVTHFNRNHKCKDCNRHFTTRGQLYSHQRQHKQQMVCNKCHKKFVLKKNFEKHLLSHTNVITSNDKSISGKKIIKRTEDKRTKQDNLPNKKLFHCSYCNIYYKTKQSLDRHYKQQHPRSKLPGQKQKSTIVKCKWCSLLITRNNLRRHITLLHPYINPIKCGLSAMAVKVRASLRLHNSRIHKV